jgi:hypothetical protein
MLTTKKHAAIIHLPFILVYIFVSSFVIQACAQKSPAEKAENVVDGVTIKIEYHSPRVRDRVIWGDLVPYDEVWRTGANNATTFEVDNNITIGKQKVPAGKYSLFTIPKKGEPWVVILNKEAEQWGAYNYKEAEDLMRFEVETKRLLEVEEEMTFEIDDTGVVSFSWEYLSFEFQVKSK